MRPTPDYFDERTKELFQRGDAAFCDSRTTIEATRKAIGQTPWIDTHTHTHQ